MQKRSNRIIKDGKVVTDDWTIIANTSDKDEKARLTHIIVALEQLQSDDSLQQRDDVGVWINNDINLADINSLLVTRPIVAINFPVFMDGRGFSLARLLRERYQYKGEIRAIGHVIRDQLCYLKRCGFNAFSFSDKSINLDAAVISLNDFTEAYQTSVDIPQPLFRRRA